MASSTANEDRVDIGTTLLAVASDQTRAVLRSLQHTDGDEIGLEPLTRAVAERLQKGTLTEEAHCQWLRTELHHNHLPKLDAAGLVVYDAERKSVRNTVGELEKELLDTVEPYDSTRR